MGMKFLTDQEVGDWVAERGFLLDPYRSGWGKHFLQFALPEDWGSVQGLLRGFFEVIFDGEELMIHFTDWSTYRESEMIAIQGIRKGSGEDSWLIEKPGHLIGPNEIELGMTLFGLGIIFGWSCYLYGSGGRVALLNWEGALLDFFGEREEELEIFYGLAREFRLEERGGSGFDALSV